jgi:hypothetical protein
MDPYKAVNDKIQAAAATVNVEELLKLYEAGDQKTVREIFKNCNGAEAAAAWSLISADIGNESFESKLKRVQWFQSAVVDIVLGVVRPLVNVYDNVQ